MFPAGKHSLYTSEHSCLTFLHSFGPHYIEQYISWPTIINKYLYVGFLRGVFDPPTIEPHSVVDKELVTHPVEIHEDHKDRHSRWNEKSKVAGGVLIHTGFWEILQGGGGHCD